MKIIGMCDNTKYGYVISISRSGVVFEKNGKRVVYSLANVEKMFTK